MRIDPRDALFIDFDGTLIDLAAHPSAIVVPKDLANIIECLFDALGGALAVVSGRPIDEIDRYLGLPARIPVAGVHGAQLRTGSGMLEVPVVGDELIAIRAAVERFARCHPALFVEPKPVSLAVHFRADPSLADKVYAELARLVEQAPDLKLMHGHAVCEIKPVWASKGAAIERLMQLPAFRGRRPLMIGDDVTDEDGFRVALAAGGRAIKVGQGPTLASERLAGPADVRRWLAESLESLSRTDA
ncbi:MAG: trehalose-phosphatase [Burkholderiaceae bacterium]